MAELVDWESPNPVEPGRSRRAATGQRGSGGRTAGGRLSRSGHPVCMSEMRGKLQCLSRGAYRPYDSGCHDAILTPPAPGTPYRSLGFEGNGHVPTLNAAKVVSAAVHETDPQTNQPHRD